MDIDADDDAARRREAVRDRRVKYIAARLIEQDDQAIKCRDSRRRFGADAPVDRALTATDYPSSSPSARSPPENRVTAASLPEFIPA